MDPFLLMFLTAFFSVAFTVWLVDDREKRLRKEIDFLSRRLSFVERETVLKDAFTPDEFCEAHFEMWQRQQAAEKRKED